MDSQYDGTQSTTTSGHYGQVGAGTNWGNVYWYHSYLSGTSCSGGCYFMGSSGVLSEIGRKLHTTKWGKFKLDINSDNSYTLTYTEYSTNGGDDIVNTYTGTLPESADELTVQYYFTNYGSNKQTYLENVKVYER